MRTIFPPVELTLVGRLISVSGDSAEFAVTRGERTWK